jgi:cardiolipin synthase
LQEAFAVDWAFATGEQLVGESWFPKLSRTGDTWARGIPHGPDEDFEIIHFVILAALAAATGTVRIATPYFLPDASIIHALNIAAMRGVEVKIILPEVSNVRLAQWASQASYWQVLEHGCRIFLSPPPFDHTKLLLVDGIWTLLGSTNWDPRSLRLNFEFNVECYQESLAGVLEGDLDARCSASREITLSDVQARGLPVRLRDGVARLFSPYL